MGASVVGPSRYSGLHFNPADVGWAYHHTAAALTSPTNSGSSGHPQHITQLSTGWSHSASLTASGSVHVWFPFSDEYEAALTPEAELHGPLGVHEDDESRALKWGTVTGEPVWELEEIPRRPVWDEKWTEVAAEGRMRQELEDEWDEWTSTRDAETLQEKVRVVKIASGLDFVLALKGNGEVWIRRVGQQERNAVWEYVNNDSVDDWLDADLSSCPSSPARPSRTSPRSTDPSPPTLPSRPRCSTSEYQQTPHPASERIFGRFLCRVCKGRG